MATWRSPRTPPRGAAGAAGGSTRLGVALAQTLTPTWWQTSRCLSSKRLSPCRANATSSYAWRMS
eukprot:590834-Prymnesium_polylepis.1